MNGNLDNEESFPCDIYGASFKYKKGLNEHIRVKHEGPSGAQTFKCVLTKRLASSDDLLLVAFCGCILLDDYNFKNKMDY